MENSTNEGSCTQLCSYLLRREKLQLSYQVLKSITELHETLAVVDDS